MTVAAQSEKMPLMHAVVTPVRYGELMPGYRGWGASRCDDRGRGGAHPDSVSRPAGSPTRGEPLPDPFPTEDEVAERAFELCFVVRSSCLDGVGYLEAAEQDLLDRCARRALQSTPQ